MFVLTEALRETDREPQLIPRLHSAQLGEFRIPARSFVRNQESLSKGRAPQIKSGCAP